MTHPTEEKPSNQRPEHPDFWCKRFGEGTTPWDQGGVPIDFVDFIQSQKKPLDTVIPGCGSAWEAAWLADCGYPVTAIDFSKEALARAKVILEKASSKHRANLVCADFFEWHAETPPELIYERAFLCAIPKKLRSKWGETVARLLPQGGLLAGFFFVCDQPKGPPFGIFQEELEQLLYPAFSLEEDRPTRDSMAVFAGRERWQVWRRC